MGYSIAIIVSASIFLDVWDLASLSFVITFFRSYFYLSGLTLSVAVSSANIGAVMGSISGAYLVERFGRKRMLLSNMLIFFASSIAIVFSPSIYLVIPFRILMGFGIGSDVVTGFTYIYEYANERQRQTFYPLWGYSFSAIAILAIVVVFVSHLFVTWDQLWKIVFMIAAIFSVSMLFLRYRLMETPLWLYLNRKYSELENVMEKAYGKTILSLSDPPSRERIFGDSLKFLRSKRMAFVLSLNGIVGFIGWGFSFYVTYMLSALHLYTFNSILGIDMIIYGSALIAAYISGYISKRFGVYKSTVVPSALSVASLLALVMVFLGYLPQLFVVPLIIAVIFFDYLGPMAYNAVLNIYVNPETRSAANGMNYMVNKVIESASGLSAGMILIEFGLGINTLMLTIIAGVLFVFAAYFGRSL
ncbi:metabolite transporter [Thermoplasma volcanium GSS1]|uniref:Metabolite transporter n=2 Tax=Thermoplasma volcanium TaxID=50339 RepID=Q97C59_THEVO|nr:metabolite transporter [Thermoplasma volcanium GSS1]